jgi:hypothetical protein
LRNISEYSKSRSRFNSATTELGKSSSSSARNGGRMHNGASRSTMPCADSIGVIASRARA